MKLTESKQFNLLTFNVTIEFKKYMIDLGMIRKMAYFIWLAKMQKFNIKILNKKWKIFIKRLNIRLKIVLSLKKINNKMLN